MNQKKKSSEVALGPYGLMGDNLNKVIEIQRAFEAGLWYISDNLIVDYYQTSNQIWLNIVTDAFDTWRFYPTDMINDAQSIWETRCEELKKEVDRRSIKI
jgi:hypothetical protein